MLNRKDILATQDMIDKRHLDIRTITMGINLLDCCECGCCAYNCPAGVPLVLAFRSAKQKLTNARAAEKKQGGGA